MAAYIEHMAHGNGSAWKEIQNLRHTSAFGWHMDNLWLRQEYMSYLATLHMSYLTHTHTHARTRTQKKRTHRHTQSHANS
jgi:hypothetical protein